MFSRALFSLGVSVSLVLVAACAMLGQSVSEGSAPCSQVSKSYSEAQCLSDLASVYHSNRNYAEEVAILKRLVSIREKAPGRNKRDLAVALRWLGNAFMSARSYPEAELVFRRALTIQETARKRNNRELGDTLHLLGHAYLSDGRYSDAEISFSRGLAVRQRAFPPGSPGYANVAESFEDLGVLYEAQGKLGKAEARLKSAVRVLDEENKPGPDALLITRDRDRLGRLYIQEARFEDAERQFKRALKVIDDEPNLGIFAVPTLRDYADLLDQTNRPSEAQKLRDRARAIVAAARQRMPAPVVGRP